ncbi:MAG TPA: hypothetical protein VGR26_13840 [Acidimicrobiales bacterium]|nr:hypothetical protein [Acidimicrobiales bacterium]
MRTPTGDHRWMRVLSGLTAIVLAAGVASAVAMERGTGSPPLETSSKSVAPPLAQPLADGTLRATGPSTTTSQPLPPKRDVSAYRGLGAWVDAFDYGPAYHRPREGPLLVPDDLDDMAARGVGTVFLQAARLDDRSPEGIVDRGLVAAFLARAHDNGMQVVGWYLPKFADVEADLANLRLIRDFDVEGHRFDGIAVDIEYRKDVPDHAERNRRLIDLSRRLREESGGQALGAIVYPPVLLEEIRPGFWPDFPWTELAESYDVWLPMVYWTEIAREAPLYGDGYGYTEAGIRTLMAHLAGGSALIHAVGGVADTSTVSDFEGFVRAVGEAGALGFSMYDYRTTSDAGWGLLAPPAPGSG